MKGINSLDENGYWSRYSNGKWSVRKIYDDVLGYEYALSGESFDALEIVDKLASLEAENAKLKALIERMVDCGDALNEFIPDPEDNGIELSVVLWNALKTELEVMKGGEG